MKHAALIIALAVPASADGFNPALTDPEVIAPRAAWSGPYVGLTYSRVTETSETVECFKLGQPRACDDPVFAYYPEYREEIRTQIESSDNAAGVLLGYRFDMGRVVPGVELGIYGGEAVPAVSLGVDLGRVLPFASYSRNGASVGLDVRIGDRLTAGVRAADGAAAVTIGWAF